MLKRNKYNQGELWLEFKGSNIIKIKNCRVRIIN